MSDVRTGDGGTYPLLDEPVKVGIAGLGRSGWGLHAKTVAELPAIYQVTGITDPIAERRSQACRTFGCPSYADFSSLVTAENIELVVLATPSHLHARQAIEALSNGKHVLVEKPFAISAAAAAEMMTAARRAGKLIVACQNRRFSADFLKVREVIASGCLGAIIEIKISWHRFARRWDWQTLRKYGGGTLNNDASHAVDQALLLLGDQDPEVSCQLVRTPLCLGDAEDHVKIILTAPGSPLIDLEFSSACAYPQDRWLVLGTRGTLAGGDGCLRWRYTEPGSLSARRVSEEPPADRGYGHEELRWVEREYDLTGEEYVDGHRRLYQHLYGALRGSWQLAITPDSIQRQMAVLEKCRTAGIFQVEENYREIGI